LYYDAMLRSELSCK